MVFVLILGIGTTLYFKSVIMKSYQESITQSCEKIASSFDVRFEQLGVVCNGISNDAIVRDALSYFSNNQKTADPLLERDVISRLSSVLFSVPNIYRVMVVNDKLTRYFHYGYEKENAEIIRTGIQDLEWYKESLEESGDHFIVPPRLDPWSDRPKNVISYISKVDSYFGSYIGHIEIQIPFSEIEKICDEKIYNEKTLFFIIDKNNAPIYPYSENGKSNASEYDAALFEGISGTFTNKFGQNVTYYKSNSADWTVFTIGYPSQMYQEIYYYIFIISLSCLGILFVFTLSYFYLSKYLSKPILILIEKAKNISYSNNLLESVGQENNEFSIIDNAFTVVTNNLKQALNLKYESELRETKARLIALQAQMNPHFIFNTLNIIAMAGDEQEDDTVSKMCCKLSNMLRYTISVSDKLTTIGSEIQHTKDYLSLMKSHYETLMEYTIDVDSLLLGISMPKLCIQPFVENCINHGFKNAPIWRLQVIGAVISNSQWELKIIDNGIGFDLSAIKDIEILIQNNSNHSPESWDNALSIENGRGILNTILRMKIFYENQIWFRVENLMPNGACISIIGYIPEGEK